MLSKRRGDQVRKDRQPARLVPSLAILFHPSSHSYRGRSRYAADELERGPEGGAVEG
jgi:hypothetical protein